MTTRPASLAVHCLAILALSLVPASCSSRQRPRPVEPPAPARAADWTTTLAVPPGSSLPKQTPLWSQVITLFALTEARMAGAQYFVAGTGYAEIDGGGRYFAGPNRQRDPYLEVTILATRGTALAQCQSLLVHESLTEHAIRITGTGLFAARPGIADRQLGILRLDTLQGCQLVARR